MVDQFDGDEEKSARLAGMIVVEVMDRLTADQKELLLSEPWRIGEMVATVEAVVTNPKALAVDDILDRLRGASLAQGWGISEEVIATLRGTAPPAPKGRLSFLSLRLRFGEGQDGVERTFDAHVAEIARVYGKDFSLGEYLRGSGGRLRLSVDERTHHEGIEWCVIDVGTHRIRHGTDGAYDNVADEGLALTWLYPEYVQGIDGRGSPSFYLAGYQANMPEYGMPWSHTPVVWRSSEGRVGLDGSYLKPESTQSYSVASFLR